MAEQLERIYKVTADATQAINQLDKIARATGNIDAKMSSFAASVKSTFASIASAGAVLGALKTSVAFADEIIDMADAFNASAESMLKLQGAFQSFGGKAENVTTVLTKVSQAANDALQGNEEARKSFTDLGISMDQIAGKNADEVFLILADAISKLPTKLEQTAASADRFGKGIKGIDIDAFSKSLGTAAEQAGYLDTQLRAAAAGQDALEKSWKFAKTTMAALVGEVALFLGLVNAPVKDAGPSKFISQYDEATKSYVKTLNQAWVEQEKLKESQNKAQIKPLQVKGAKEAKKDNDEYVASLKKASEEQKQWTERMKDSLDPLREIEREATKANLAFELGDFTAEEYAASIQKIVDKGLGLDKMKDTIDEIGIAIGNSLASGIAQLVDVFFEADQSFQQFASNFLKSIAKMIAQIIILRTLQASLGKSAVGTFLFGAKANATGNAYAGSTGLPQGVYSSPTFFAMPDAGLHKFANGGVPGLGVLAEAGRSEAIVPLVRHGADLGVKASPVIVNVNNNVSEVAEVQVQETNKPDGSKQIEVMIVKKIKQAIADGSLDRSFRGAYGLSRTPA